MEQLVTSISSTLYMQTLGGGALGFPIPNSDLSLAYFMVSKNPLLYTSLLMLACHAFALEQNSRLHAS